MLRVVFKIEAGNYYSKSTFIMTLIKQEKQGKNNFTGKRVSKDFQFPISGSRNNSLNSEGQKS